MLVNKIILVLIFVAGSVFIAFAIINPAFINSDDQSDENAENLPRSKGLLSLFGSFKSNKRRQMYFYLGVGILVLGVVALLTDFINKPIEF